MPIGMQPRTIRKQFEAEYSKTAPLYYRGQIPFDTILARIQRDLVRLYCLSFSFPCGSLLGTVHWNDFLHDSLLT